MMIVANVVSSKNPLMPDSFEDDSTGKAGLEKWESQDNMSEFTYLLQWELLMQVSFWAALSLKSCSQWAMPRSS